MLGCGQRAIVFQIKGRTGKNKVAMIVQADSENANRFLNSITRRFFVYSFFLAGQKNYTGAHTL
jgi:hypothetical protein